MYSVFMIACAFVGPSVLWAASARFDEIAGKPKAKKAPGTQSWTREAVVGRIDQLAAAVTHAVSRRRIQ